jgi:hypothetical protein
MVTYSPNIDEKLQIYCIPKLSTETKIDWVNRQKQFYGLRQLFAQYIMNPVSPIFPALLNFLLVEPDKQEIQARVDYEDDRHVTISYRVRV